MKGLKTHLTIDQRTLTFFFGMIVQKILITFSTFVSKSLFETRKISDLKGFFGDHPKKSAKSVISMLISKNDYCGFVGNIEVDLELTLYTHKPLFDPSRAYLNLEIGLF